MVEVDGTILSASDTPIQGWQPKAPPRIMKSTIAALFAYWQRRMGLTAWRVKVTFSHKALSPDHTSDSDSFPVAMTTRVSWPYRLMDVVVDLNECRGRSSLAVTSLIVHELLHGPLAEIAEASPPTEPGDADRDHEWRGHLERVTTDLTMMVLRIAFTADAPPDAQLP